MPSTVCAHAQWESTLKHAPAHLDVEVTGGSFLCNELPRLTSKAVEP